MKKFRITLNEDQMYTLKECLEMYFRIDLLQEDMLAEKLATMNDLDLSPDNPNHEKIFDSYIERKEHIGIVLKSAFEIASPWAFRATSHRKRDTKSLVIEDIWQVCRYCLWENNPNKEKLGYVVDSNKPLQISDQELPTIECVEK